jgi:sugar lactone lactonase YvrE
MAKQPEVLLDGLAFPEGPRWHEGRFWFSDMHAHEVVTVTVDGQRDTVLEVENQPSGLGWLPDGRLLVVSMTDQRVLRQEPDGSVVTHADLSAQASWWCNDMVVDGQGRAWVGNFGFDLFAPSPERRPAEIIRVDPDGTTTVVCDDAEFPNGSVITPDGSTLIVGESMGNRLRAFTIAADGTLTDDRIWADLGDNLPDGICLDADGAIWSADPINGGCLRVAEGGEVLDRIETGRGCFACMLGGEDRRTLLLCTADDSDPEKCRLNRTGRLETVRVDVPGAGLP